MSDADMKSLLEKTVNAIKAGLIGKTQAEPLLALIKTDGSLLPLPWPDVESMELRQRLLHLGGRAISFAYRDIVAAIHVGECWYAEDKAPTGESHEDFLRRYAAQPNPPSKRADRKECVVAVIVTKEKRKTMSIIMDIQRNGKTIVGLPDKFDNNTAYDVKAYILGALLDGMAGLPFDLNQGE